MQILSIMSGSSLDGVDVALISMVGDPDAPQWDWVFTATIPFSQALVNKLSKADQLSIKDFVELEVEYTDTLIHMIRDLGLKADLAIIHGHTALHEPHRGYSLQIVSGGRFAVKTHIDTLVDLRQQDIALGGQGAPLAVLVDQVLFPQYDYLLNLGGIANISIKGDDYLSYDLVGCNQMLNYFSAKLGYVYDDQGLIASKGTVNQEALSLILEDKYSQASPPKSLSNQYVQSMIQNLVALGCDSADILHTCCIAIAQLISKAISPSNEVKWLLPSGGGAFNTFLLKCIEDALTPSNVRIYKPDDLIISFKECLLLALLGYRYVHHKSTTVPEATGASRSVIGGAFYKSDQ